MKLSNIIPLVLMSAALLCSCKDKGDETTEYKYLDGSIVLDIPSFVKPGDTFTFVRSEISTLHAPDCDESQVTYYLTDPYTSKKDTLDQNWTSVSFTVKDTLGSFSYTIKGFYEGYLNSTGTAAFTTIDPSFPDGSLSDTGISTDDASFTDTRDKNKYYTVEIGDQVWMRNNLAWGGSGVAYKESEATVNMFGRFYSFDEALGACPDGWELPSDADWQKLSDFCGGNVGELMSKASFNGEPLWQYWPEVKVTDGTGLCLLPLGYSNPAPSGSEFQGFGEYAAFWTSTEEEGLGVYRYIYQDKAELFRHNQTKDIFRLPVRCIKK